MLIWIGDDLMDLVAQIQALTLKGKDQKVWFRLPSPQQTPLEVHVFLGEER